ncbi:putative PhoH family protein [Magnetofaba australis IT-1]|uniref:PhoH-like protein n=2 Tax=Magnetofaba TaxID=1472292 RepID=A0A1Y2K579_9PROT|nr:putative PhoH family protein [Magnetofaba australis IT-1]
MAKQPHSEKLSFPDNGLAIVLFGEADAHLRLIEHQLGVVISPRGNALALTGRKSAIKKTRQLLTELYAMLERGETVDLHRVEDGLKAMTEETDLGDVYASELLIKTPKRNIYPRNARQAAYIESILTADMTFAIGPAGTGKTYLAVAAAVSAYLEGRVGRIILTRPAVEAGERLGFLPGDLQAKVDPYLRPLYDALYDMLGGEKVEKLTAQGVLEIAPLAYMRGRTLEEAFIILDEGQNTTPEQMKMFLTRLGEGSKMVISGDVTQIDLPAGQMSGLVQALAVLKGVKDIRTAVFTARDVVRHGLVEKIVRAYEADSSSSRSGKGGKG